MPVFLEKYLLQVVVTLTVLVVFVNPMRFDWTQRITGGLALCFFAYFLSHTLHKLNNPPKPITSSELAQRAAKSRAEELRRFSEIPPTPSVNTPEMEQPREAPTRERAGSSAQPPMPQAPKTRDSMPNSRGVNDRSVRIGDGNRFSNSPIVTGDNAKVDIHAGPAKPFVLTAEEQRKVTGILAECPGGEIALVCIGRGCQSMSSVVPALTAAGWRFEITQIGVYSSIGGAVDISSGIHVMDKGASPIAGNVLGKALRAVGLQFEPAPWQSFGNPELGLCLVIGNPE